MVWIVKVLFKAFAMKEKRAQVILCSIGHVVLNENASTPDYKQ